MTRALSWPLALFVSLLLACLAPAGCDRRPTPPPSVEDGPAEEEPVDARPASGGPVRLDGRAFADDTGPFNALGASMFWALWAEKHDGAKLEANLAHLAGHGFDYVRVLAMVGAPPTWADRTINPRWPDYWSVVDAFFDRLARHRLRAHVTLFADAQLMMPDRGDREAFVAAWAARVNQYRDRVLAVEVANEHWQNGLPTAEVQAYGRQLQQLTPAPVALSAPQEHAVRDMYDGWRGAVATMHYDRDVRKADGYWRPVRQPWGWPGEYFPGDPGAVVMNSEPIGPDASVAADDDPTRLALAYVTTLVAGNAAYTYHTGAGVTGGGAADLARGRRPNLFDYDHTIARALGHWRRTLPAGIANFTRHNAQWESMPWDGSQRAVERGDIVRAYAASAGSTVVGVMLGVRRPHEIRARRTLSLELLDAVTGDTVAIVGLAAGQTWTVPADRSGYVIRGTF